MYLHTNMQVCTSAYLHSVVNYLLWDYDSLSYYTYYYVLSVRCLQGALIWKISCLLHIHVLIFIIFSNRFSLNSGICQNFHIMSGGSILLIFFFKVLSPLSPPIFTCKKNHLHQNYIILHTHMHTHFCVPCSNY